MSRRWKPVLLREAMHQDGHVSAVEKVKDPIVLSPNPDPKLMDPSHNVIRKGAAELVASGSEFVDCSGAFRIGSRVPAAQVTEPIEDRCIACGFPEEMDIRGWQSTSANYSKIAIMRRSGGGGEAASAVCVEGGPRDDDQQCARRAKGPCRRELPGPRGGGMPKGPCQYRHGPLDYRDAEQLSESAPLAG